MGYVLVLLGVWCWCKGWCFYRGVGVVKWVVVVVWCSKGVGVRVLVVIVGDVGLINV